MVVVGASVVVGAVVVDAFGFGFVAAAAPPAAGPATVAASATSATTATVAAARARAPPIPAGSMPAGIPERYAGLPHLAGAAFPVGLAELELLELAGRGARAASRAARPTSGT